MSEFVRKQVGRKRADSDPLTQLWRLYVSMQKLGCRDRTPDRQRCRRIVGRGRVGS